MKAGIFVRPDGGVSLDHPMEMSAEQRAAHDKRIADENGWEHAGHCERDNLPTSRYFRGQWRLSGKRVAVDIGLAREHKLKLIRAERDKRLAATDAEHMRLSEIGTKTQNDALAEKRQTLRDIPQVVDLGFLDDAADLEAYEVEWPE